jgi:hypothetical protein
LQVVIYTFFKKLGMESFRKEGLKKELFVSPANPYLSASYMNGDYSIEFTSSYQSETKTLSIGKPR